MGVVASGGTRLVEVRWVEVEQSLIPISSLNDVDRVVIQEDDALPSGVDR